MSPSTAATVLIGVLMALAIGMVCRLMDLPLPAPPTLRGALLVMAMTVGFLVGGLVQ
jgi:XapX domain-containing protein